VASGEALVMLHWEMRFISHQRTAMAIEMARDGGAFVRSCIRFCCSAGSLFYYLFCEVWLFSARQNTEANAYNALFFTFFFSSLIIAFPYLRFFSVLTVNVTLFIFL